MPIRPLCLTKMGVVLSPSAVYANLRYWGCQCAEHSRAPAAGRRREGECVEEEKKGRGKGSASRMDS